MKKPGIVNFIKDEVIGSENTILAWAVLAATGVIVGIGFYLNSPDASFSGIAGSRESNVNFEYPVEIRSVQVLQGQRVKKGDLVLELDQSELNTKIRELSALRGKLRAELSVREQMNKAIGNTGENLASDPLLVEIKQYEEELSSLERQRNNLYVFAEIDGIVGSVNFKRGERAPAFAPLITISPDSPTFVQGFVNEELRTSVKPGTRVRITSFTNPEASVYGKVISVGARFVELPLRLASVARGQTSGVWGREVTVEIPKDSQIILGEKVQISPSRSLFSAFTAIADEEETKNDKDAPAAIRLPDSLVDRTAFEASGAVYLKDLKKYLVVSDDTDNKDAPWLFLLSEDGQVDENVLEIPGLSSIKDMESVSEADGYLYVMSSLTSRKKGDLDKDRNLLVRVKRNGRELSDTQYVNMGKLLRAIISESNHPLLQGLTNEGLEKLEIEAQTVRDGALYLGLKSPAYPDAASHLILRINNVADLFQSNPRVALEVWKNVRLDSDTGVAQRPTDMMFIGNNLYFTTSCKGQSCGTLWRIGENENTPKVLRTFPDLSPEGLAYDTEKNVFLVTFDMGKDGSKYTLVTGPRSRGN